MRTTNTNGRFKRPKFNGTMLLGLVPKLGQFASQAADYYVALRAAGQEVNPDIIATYVADVTADWHPVVSGRDVLRDAGTRYAGARFLAGVVFNFYDDGA